jgi:diadenylate cyclase
MTAFKELWALITGIQLNDVVDILLVAVLFYFLFSLLKGTRSAIALRGLISVLLISFLIYFVARLARLSAITFLFKSFWLIAVLMFILLFQGELRRALTEVGQIKLFRHFFKQGEEYVDEIVKAISIMSNRRIGALIAIERHNPLKTFVDTGVVVDSMVTSELLRTIFAPFSPLHDGAVVIRNDRVVSAGCILPLSDDPTLSKELGTRHRAALGLSEESDALVVVISEETGTISLAVMGRLDRGLDVDELKEKLTGLLDIKVEKKDEA